MTLRTIYIFLFLLIFNNLEAIDNYQQKIYDAEYYILIDRYELAILKYKEAQRIRPIDLIACNNFFHIIICDSNLKKQYLDTFISFVVHNGFNEYFQNAYLYIDSNEIKKKLVNLSASKFYTEINNRKAKIKEQLQLIQDEDQKIRREAINAVGREWMYTKEPYRTKIHLVDSINYIQFCHILKEINCDKYITNVILDFPGLLNHFLIYPDSSMTEKLSLLISECIEKDVHGKEKLAVSLENNYNTSRYHKPNSNYNVMIDFVMTDNSIFYKYPTREILDELNIKRNELGLESVERFLAKLIWTKKHDCGSPIRLINDLRKFVFKNNDDEKEFIENFLNLGYKSLSVKCTGY